MDRPVWTVQRPSYGTQRTPWIHMIGWNFEESFYFVMMTFTTVGFGDYHVTKRIENCSTGTMGPSTRGDNLGSTSCHDSDSTVSHDHYLLITMLYILCGLILTGSTFNFLIIHCMVPKKEEITVRFYLTTFKNEDYTSVWNYTQV